MTTATEVRERPILFGGKMVRAILDGRKTQTRRVVTPQPERGEKYEASDPWLRGDGLWQWQNGVVNYEANARRCPYGQPGDRLWVRETWQYADWTEDGYPFIGYAADESRALMDRGIPDEWSDKLADVWTDLSAPENYAIDNRAADRRWRPSIHMPRWASRISLELTGIRVERLDDMTEADAVAEGYQSPVEHGRHVEASVLFRRSWGTRYARTAADLAFNPWVWVLEFRPCSPLLLPEGA